MNLKRSFVLYLALAVGIAGTLAIWMVKRTPLAIGWWLGVGIGVLNFSSLLSSVQRSQKEVEGGAKKVTTKLSQRFFIRYLALAGAFFLVIQLGREQFGSALLGFLSFYVVTFLDYIFRVRKQKP